MFSIRPNVFKRVFPYLYVHCFNGWSFMRISIPIFTQNKRNPTQTNEIEIIVPLPIKSKRGWEFGFPYFPLAASWFFKRGFKTK